MSKTDTAEEKQPAMRSAFDWSREGEHALINGKYLSRGDHEKFIERIQQDAIASQRAEPQAQIDGDDWQVHPRFRENDGNDRHPQKNEEFNWRLDPPAALSIISIKRRIRLPKPVNFILLDGMDCSIPVQELSDEELKEFGEACTAQLIDHARSRR
jgi:hypothetical protein